MKNIQFLIFSFWLLSLHLLSSSFGKIKQPHWNYSFRILNRTWLRECWNFLLWKILISSGLYPVFHWWFSNVNSVNNKSKLTGTWTTTWNDNKGIIKCYLIYLFMLYIWSWNFVKCINCVKCITFIFKCFACNIEQRPESTNHRTQN